MGSTSTDIAWYSESSGTVDIYRNGTYVDSALASSLGWNGPAVVQGVPDYTLVLNSTPVSYRGALLNVDITAALNWSTSRAYFFRSDGRYVRYNKTTDQSDSGYPVDTTNRNWPGLGNYAQDIRATLRRNGNKVFFFFANGTYSRYDLVNKSVDSGYPKPINNSTWPGRGNYATQITEQRCSGMIRAGIKLFRQVRQSRGFLRGYFYRAFYPALNLTCVAFFRQRRSPLVQVFLQIR